MEIAYYILKELKKKQVDDIIIEVNKSEASQLKFSDNKIVKTGSEILIDLSIFLAKDKKIVTTSIKNFEKKNVDQVIKNLLKFTKNIKPNKDYMGIAQGPFKYKEVKQGYDKKVHDFDEVDLVQKGINAALENSRRTNGILEKHITENFLITSNNVQAKDKSTSLYFSIRTFAAKDASGHMNSCSNMLNKLKVEEAGRKAGEIAKQALNPVAGKPGKYNVVFGYMPMAALLNHIMEAASIFEVEAGLSFLANKLNKKLSNFTLIDDGILENGFNSSKFDAEGVPSQRTYVIKNGVLKTYLHNTSTAKRYKTKTTANAGLIAPNPSNIILQGKKGNIFDIKHGLYITNVWYTRYQNHLTGDFSTIPRDGIFLIENGEITKSLKNLRISDNFVNLMKNISLMSKKIEQLRSWEAHNPVVTPEVLIKNVNISKPKL